MENCPVCKNYAWHGNLPAIVRGVRHHPVCPILNPFGGPRFGLDTTSILNAANSVTGAANVDPYGAGVMGQVEKAVGSNPVGDITQGTKLFNQGEDMSGGNYAGLLSAVGSLVSDLPPGPASEVLAAIVTIGEDAAMGAAIGSAIAPYGTVIGAVVGTLIGGVQSILDIPPIPPQADFRPSWMQMIFPGTANGANYSVIPGIANHHPRTDKDSIFYQLPSGSDWAQSFNFGIGWTRPPKASSVSQAAGWALAQWYVGVDSVTLAHAQNPKSALDKAGIPARAKLIQQSKYNCATQMQSTVAAERAYKKLCSWYGEPGLFPTMLPDLDNSKIPLPPKLGAAWKSLKGAYGGGGSNNGVTPGAPAVVMDFFQKCPADRLYYPVYTHWDGNMDAYSNAKNATAVYSLADTVLLSLAEAAALDLNDALALHMMLGMAHIWYRTQRSQMIVDPTIVPTHHPNLMRVIGIISRRVKTVIKSRKGKPGGMNVGASGSGASAGSAASNSVGGGSAGGAGTKSSAGSASGGKSSNSGSKAVALGGNTGILMVGGLGLAGLTAYALLKK
jgi:hypothetical protein